MNEKVKYLSIIGAGFTGKQIAAHAALYNYNIHVFDINSDILEVAKKYITGVLKRKNKIEKIEKVYYSTNLNEALKETDLVIEAVPEDLPLKKKVFSQIDDLAPPHAIIATNSSSYPVSKIEDAVQRKDKVLNIHFYPPIPTRPMADIARGTQTSDETFEIGKSWIESIECTPLVVKKDCLGFVFNRLWRAVKKECIEIWAGGFADVEDVDKAWKIFTGMNMGPYTLMDGIGLDVVYAVELSYYEETGDPKDKPPQDFKELVERGELGMKTGKGFYNWRKK